MAIVRIHQWSHTIFCQQTYYTPSMQILLRDIDHYIKHPLRVLKDDPTSTVVVVEIDGNKLVIKRANTKDWMHFIRRFFSQSRARKNWHFAHQLLKMGINTFTPVAIKEERFGFLKGRSYFISTYIEGIDALHYFAYGAKVEPLFERVATNIANMINCLARNWLSHRDLNLSNIILVDSEPWLIDLDSMRRHYLHVFAKRGAKRERARFMENWLEAPDVLPETVALFEKTFAQDF